MQVFAKMPVEHDDDDKVAFRLGIIYGNAQVVAIFKFQLPMALQPFNLCGRHESEQGFSGSFCFVGIEHNL